MMNGNQVLKCDLLEIFFPMILWCAHWYISLRWCHARIICDWGFQSHLVVIIEAKSHITLNAARWIFSLKTIRFSLGFPFVASLRQESQVSDPDYLNSSTLSPLLATIRVNIYFSVNVSRNSDVTAGLWSSTLPTRVTLFLKSHIMTWQSKTAKFSKNEIPSHSSLNLCQICWPIFVFGKVSGNVSWFFNHWSSHKNVKQLW